MKDMTNSSGLTSLKVVQRGYQTPGYWRLFLFVFLLLSNHIITLGQKPLPELWGIHVHDEAKLLSQQTVDEIERQLRVYEDSTSNQIAILIINSLEGEVLEEYTLRVAEKWKLGQKDKDNGVLLLIAVDDHKMRIEVGYGLEGVVTDAMASRIIRNELAPNFRKDDYDTGVISAVNAIIAAIGGEYRADETDENSTEELGLKERIFLSVFIFGILGVFTAAGIFTTGCAGWFFYAFLIPFYAIFPMIILSKNGGIAVLATYVIGFPILKMMVSKTPWGKRMASKAGAGQPKGGGWSSSSGWFGSSGGWSSGGSSGGSFSGGGGSFGGGGSSGSW
jgi:uncharacterized protein